MARTPALDYYIFTCPTEGCGNTCNFDEKPAGVLCTACGNVIDLA